MNHVGIDVSQKELVVVVSAKGKARPAKNFENTATGHREIIQLLAKLKGETRICLEATGVYHFDLAVAFSRTDGLEVMVINPKAAHNFAQALMKRSKTDTIDAVTLAAYCERMPFEPVATSGRRNHRIKSPGTQNSRLKQIKNPNQKSASCLKGNPGYA